jgi:hypothetical protein
LRDGKSKREVLREHGMHWTTLEKIPRQSQQPVYRVGKERGKPKLGSYLRRIEEILKVDLELPKKPRQTMDLDTHGGDELKGR